MMFFFVLSFFPRGVLDKILNLIESVSEGFPSYSQQAPTKVVKIIALVSKIARIHMFCIDQNRKKL